MNETEQLTRYTANFIDELVVNGLQDVVISPGSRSTPLAVLFAEHEKVNDWIVIDERSAAYFALGIAQAKQRPVALVCTSGTAAANYLPAVVEAYYARVPLVVLTADRPHELRNIGASQTIEQVGMYGDFVKKFFEMAPPENDERMIDYVRNRAFRVMKITEDGNPGPVHVNFPFREPLMPDVSLPNLWNGREIENSELFTGNKRLQEVDLQSLSRFMTNHPNGLIVCGPQVDKELGRAITSLSERLQIPILADPLSQLRAGQHRKETIIATYDTLFRSEKISKQLKPDYIVRFGAMPISKHYLFYLTEYRDVPQFVVENSDSVREPTNHRSHYILANGAQLCTDLLSCIPTRNDHSDWLAKWTRMEEIASEQLTKVEHDTLTEGLAIRNVIDSLKERHHLFVANSMPVRDVDTFFMSTNKNVTLYANRGVSGIDGTLSSALGVATTGERVTLVIGDLSFYHDINSLLIAKRYQLPITIVLINNNGGGIFSFLPQAKEEKHFEHLFGTPLHIEFQHAVTMFAGNYHLVTNEMELTNALELSYATDQFTVIEVQTDRNENVAWHRALWENISQRLERND